MPSCISRVGAAGLLLGALAAVSRADDCPGTVGPTDCILVQATLTTDERLQQHVEQALDRDPVLLSDHIKISVRNGIVTVSGQIFDEWDMRRVLRTARRIPGVRRVVNELEFIQGGE
jgi:hypothetical protein